MSNPDPAWSLDAQDDFVLEEDDTFGVGELACGDLPPFDDEPELRPANESAASAMGGEDPFGLTSTIAHAPLPALARDSIWRAFVATFDSWGFRRRASSRSLRC